jgi:hypothetical protein
MNRLAIGGTSSKGRSSQQGFFVSDVEIRIVVAISLSLLAPVVDQYVKRLHSYLKP